MHRNGDTYFRPSVHDVNEVASRIGFPDGLEHLLVLEAPGTEAGQGLAAPADGRLRDTAASVPTDPSRPGPQQQAPGSRTPQASLWKHLHAFQNSSLVPF